MGVLKGIPPKLRKQLASLASGDVQFVVYPTSAGHSAAALSIAPVGTVTQTLEIQIQNTAGEILEFLNGFTVDVSVSATSFADAANPEDPTLSSATPTITNGRTSVVLTYDTNLSATPGTDNVYTEGDTITVTVSDTAQTILADSLRIADKTWTDTIIA